MTMKKLTIKECETAQRRMTDAYGSKYPYKGSAYWHGLNGSEPLPAGYIWIHIPTWGIHLRRVDDTDHMADL